MQTLTPVDHDPFAAPAPPAGGGGPGPLQVTVRPPGQQAPQLVPVDHDPFELPSAVKSFVIGAHQGVTAGWSDEIAGLADASGLPVGTPPLVTIPVGALMRLLGAKGADEAYTAGRDRFRATQGAAEKAHPTASMTGQLTGAVGAGVLPARALGVGASLIGNASRGAALGAGLGAAQGAGDAPEAKDMGEGASTGGLIGFGIGGAVPFALQGLRRVVSPLTATAERRAAVETLRNEGVTDLTAGQQTGNRGLKYLESEAGGAAADRLLERQGEQFTAAALRRVGETATRASPEVIDGALARIGQAFDDLAARNTMMFDQRLGRDLMGTVRDYFSLVSPSARAPVVQNTIDDLINAARANGGTLPGDTYQALRSRLDRASRASRNDPQLQEALFGLRNGVDAAMERSISPADRAAWQEARRQYRNMLVIEKAATGAGEKTAEGLISPAQLRTATAGQNRRAYARGRGDFADLARAGTAAMTPLPNSGTASRLAARALPQVVTSAVGAGAGSYSGGTEGAAAGAIAGFAAPRVAANVALSRLGRRYLANQIAAGADRPLALVGMIGAQPAREYLVDREAKRSRPVRRRSGDR